MNELGLKEIALINAIILAWGGIFYGVAVKLWDARLAKAIAEFETAVVDPVRAQLQRIEIETVKVATWLEASKASAAVRGRADHGSDYRINTVALAAMIEQAGYVPDPAMLGEFRRLVNDPELPADDVVLWGIIELRFGMAALCQESARFGAHPDETPAIWLMCIRRGQEIGADQLLREIKVLR
jgi:hypothetical protein